MTAHEVDYHIYGEEMQYVEIELDPQEAVVAEAGNFMMMDSGIRMETIFGDGSGQDQGIMGKFVFCWETTTYRRKLIYDCIFK